MKNLTNHLLYRGTDIDRQNMLWNIAGSFCYAFASMVLSFLVMRTVGENEGGIFAFGFSTLGQQMFIIAYFGIRPFQITDGKGEYSFGDYLEHRIRTCILAVAVGAGFLTFMCAAGKYNAYKALILLLLVIYKVIDGYADVYESEFQRQGSLYLTGKSLFFRTILSVALFFGTLVSFQNLFLSCVAAAAAQGAGLFLFDLDVIHALPSVDWKKQENSIKGITGSTAFLFVSVFLDFYIFSSAKYAIDANMSNAASGYFNLIFMPTSVIYMVANFVIRPYLTKLTKLWDENSLTEFKNELRKLGLMVLGLTVVAALGTVILGKWALSVMERLLGASYAGKLTAYHGAFILIVLGGGFYALANLMYYALVIMRRQRAIFGIYAAAAAVAWFLSRGLVRRFEINGAAVCYLLLMLGLVGGFGLWTEKACRNRMEGREA
jgi:O-antigen/teichoic acid export membrane protein